MQESEAAEEYEYDAAQKNWIPRTMDPRKLDTLEQLCQVEQAGGMPQELLMSDTNILAMRVPNFSYREETTLKDLTHQ